jgi:hypothetical protein
MPETSARPTALAEGHQYRDYSWLGDYLERLEGKEAYREFQNCYLGTEQGSDYWHGDDSIRVLRATQYLVESLTGDVIPVERRLVTLALDRAREAQDWDAYLHALGTYADAARAAYVAYWGL